jgi:hypothetical protein
MLLMSSVVGCMGEWTDIMLTARFEVLMAMKSKVEVLWVVTQCCIHCQGDGGDMVLQYIGILPQHYMMSQSRRL